MKPQHLQVGLISNEISDKPLKYRIYHSTYTQNTMRNETNNTIKINGLFRVISSYYKVTVSQRIEPKIWYPTDFVCLSKWFCTFVTIIFWTNVTWLTNSLHSSRIKQLNQEPTVQETRCKFQCLSSHAVCLLLQIRIPCISLCYSHKWFNLISFPINYTV